MGLSLLASKIIIKKIPTLITIFHNFKMNYVRTSVIFCVEGSIYIFFSIFSVVFNKIQKFLLNSVADPDSDPGFLAGSGTKN